MLRQSAELKGTEELHHHEQNILYSDLITTFYKIDDCAFKERCINHGVTVVMIYLKNQSLKSSHQMTVETF